MKKHYLLLLISLLGFTSQAQIVNIPDANFKAKLLSANVTNEYAKDINGNSIVIDTNNNGEIEVSEALLVYKLFDITSSSPPFKMAANTAITDLTGIAAFTNLELLFLSNNVLPTIDLSSNTALKKIYCSSNQTTSFNLTGLTVLELLDINNNLLTTFSTNGLTALKTLYCKNNDLTSLEINNSSLLETIDCSLNQLTTLNTTNLIAMKQFNCDYNQLTSLDVSSAAQLFNLRCAVNTISSLNLENQTNLSYLDCHSNVLTALNVSANTNLQKLFCYSNFLTALELNSNINLVNVSCAYNSISILTFSNHPALKSLSCSNNLITQLDLSNTGIYNLFANNNPNLIYFNVKNGIVTPDVYVSQFPEPPFTTDNFQIENCPLLQYICHDEGEFGSLLIEHQNLTNISHGTYCSFEPGGTYNTVSGTITLDCSGSNTPFYNQKMAVSNGVQTGYTYTNHNGNYTFYNGIGNVTVVPQLENTTYFTVSPTNYTYNFTTLGNTETADFCLSANGVHPDVEVILIPITTARPGFDALYKIVYKNNGNQIQSGSVTLTFDDAVLDFVSANPMVTLQAANTLSWDFSNLNPFESRTIALSLNVNSPTETPAVVIGDVLLYQVTISTSETDETPNDNQMDFNQTVVGSFDPNDKTVVEGESISIAKIGDYLHYVVRFQNTGTFAAENIVIKDMLDAKLDWSTLEMVSSSHPYRSTLTSGNRLEVFYEGINLPPLATNEEGSHGYIAYKIKPQSTVAIDDVISNTANIYFDFNFPIVTNTVTTAVVALGTPSFSQGKLITVYPNPVSDQLQLSVASGIAIKTVTVYNTLGQKVITVGNQTTINLSSLTKGVYFVTVETDKGIATQKIIKI